MEWRLGQKDMYLRLLERLDEPCARVLGAGPAGYGKTHVSVRVLGSLLLPGQRAVVVTDLRSVVDQWDAAISDAGMADRVEAHTMARARRSGRWAVWEQLYAYVVWDECHIRDAALEAKMRQWSESGADVRVLGLTATPQRRGIERVFPSGPVWAPCPADLAAAGVLVPPRVYRVAQRARMREAGLDVDGMGQYTEESIEAESRRRVVNVIPEALRLCEQLFGERAFPRGGAFAFVRTIQQGHEYVAEFAKWGVRAAHVHSGQTPAERAEEMAAFRSGDAPVLISVNVVGRGFDHPAARLVLDLCPRTSPGGTMHWIQSTCRAGRSMAGKEWFAYMDFAGNWDRQEDAWNYYWHVYEHEWPATPKKLKRVAGSCDGCGLVVERGAMLCPGCGEDLSAECEGLKPIECAAEDEPCAVCAMAQPCPAGRSWGWTCGVRVPRCWACERANDRRTCEVARATARKIVDEAVKLEEYVPGGDFVSPVMQTGNGKSRQARAWGRTGGTTDYNRMETGGVDRKRLYLYHHVGRTVTGVVVGVEEQGEWGPGRPKRVPLIDVNGVVHELEDAYQLRRLFVDANRGKRIMVEYLGKPEKMHTYRHEWLA